MRTNCYLVVAEEILNQLGGNKFVAMTGSKNFINDGYTLRMDLAKNASKANKLWVTLDESDTYTMEFFKFTPCKLNPKTFEFVDDKRVDIEVISGVYAEDLQRAFTEVTGFDTSL